MHEFVRLDLQYAKVFPSELEPALKIATEMEPNMEKSSSTTQAGVSRMWPSSGMGKSMFNVKVAT